MTSGRAVAVAVGWLDGSFTSQETLLEYLKDESAQAIVQAITLR